MANADRYGRHNGVKVNLDFSVLKLIEEVGELYEALLIHNQKSRPEKRVPEKESRTKLGEELADVAGMLMVLSDQLGIDLERALIAKWVDHSRGQKNSRPLQLK